MPGPEHRFACDLTWTGAEAGPTTSYRTYSRAFRVYLEGKPSLLGSVAGPFRGDEALHNPEDLLLAALSACHCLSYLALAARSNIAVVTYRDAATATMALVDGGLQFVEATLRPALAIAPGG